MRFSLWSLSLLSVLIVSACTHLPKPHSPTIALDLPAQLEFTGRGSAAAFMLTGTMGAAGIAIGSAIDIGLAKEAEQSFAELGYSWQEDFKTQLEQAGYRVVDEAERRMTVQHVGFKAKGDEVSVWLEVTVADGLERTHTDYISEFTITFEEFKQEPKKAVWLLRHSINQLLTLL